MKFSGLERRERKKTKRRLMKVKLIKSYVSEVVERWGSLPKSVIMVVLLRWIAQQEGQQIKYHK